MSITSDLRGYADTAVEQGKHALDQANDAVAELRTHAEQAVNLEAIKAAVQPYLAQAKGYSTIVTDRAEQLYATVTSDKRVAKLVDTAESLTGAVLESVQSLTGLGLTPTPAARTAAEPAAPKATKPTATRAARKPTARKPAATAARKPAATAATAARKAPAAKPASKA